MAPESEVTVRAARPDDRRRIAEVMGRAFQVDPVYRWLFPDPGTRERRVGGLIGTMTRHMHAGLGEVEVATIGGAVVGAAVWDRPGAVAAGALRTARALPGMLRATGRDLPKLARLGERLEKARPARPHWYLFHLGADPSAQRRGAGRALLTSRLARCDADGAPAYLECCDENVAYYARHGFVLGDPVVIDDALSTQTMWREPRTAPDETPNSSG